MPYLTKTEGAAGPKPGTHARGNLFGDLVCPECGTQIVTPPGFAILPGWGRCPRCTKPFRVTGSVARYCNQRSQGLGRD